MAEDPRQEYRQADQSVVTARTQARVSSERHFGHIEFLPVSHAGEDVQCRQVQEIEIHTIDRNDTCGKIARVFVWPDRHGQWHLPHGLLAPGRSMNPAGMAPRDGHTRHSGRNAACVGISRGRWTKKSEIEFDYFDFNLSAYGETIPAWERPRTDAGLGPFRRHASTKLNERDRLPFAGD
jgi:hypothetical protein